MIIHNQIKWMFILFMFLSVYFLNAQLFGGLESKPSLTYNVTGCVGWTMTYDDIEICDKYYQGRSYGSLRNLTKLLENEKR